MKKKMIITTAMTLTLLGLAAGCGGSDIGEAKAKEIALQDAGVSESDISRFQSSKDRDDGRTLYEIQFASDNTEYEYEINAKDGEILNYSTETATPRPTALMRVRRKIIPRVMHRTTRRVMHRTTHRIAGRTIVELPRM